nr:LysR family transcriptional regulator [uncultured Blautia sp.]
MNLNQLTYFVTLAQIENYTRAAKRLDITQPSLSHAISNLEKELQVQLFERHGRNVTMTRYGEMFLKYVQDSLHILNLGVERIQEAARIPGGSISIGYIHTQGRRFIPELVRGFTDSRKGKKIDFHFQNAATGNLIQGLKDERFDVIFCSKAEGEKEISFVPVAEEKLIAIVPEKHPLAAKNTVSVQELGQYPQVAFPPSSGLYFVIRELFEKEGIMPETAFEVEEDGALAGMVAEGFGVAIAPDVPVIHTLPVKILNIENLHYRRYIYMGMLKNRYPSALVESFRDYILEHYRIYEIMS